MDSAERKFKLVPDRIRQEAAGRSANGAGPELIAKLQAERDIRAGELEHLSGPQTPKKESIATPDVKLGVKPLSRMPKLKP